MASAPWKNASTLMLLARNHLNQTSSPLGQYRFDYQCMLLKRSATSKFFAKAFVFPGGATEQADFSSRWLDHYAQNGFDRHRLASQLVVPNRPRIPLYEEAASSSPDCLPEVGFRISAIRETFEETGVLFCKPTDYKVGFPHHPDDLAARIGNLPVWQERVHRNPEDFLLLCQEHRLYPDIWSLYEWCNWLTPEHMGPKRYDTIFYVCVLDRLPKVRIDGKEITQIRWMDPVTSIWEFVREHIWLAPPQVYELSRLANFSTADDLKFFAEKRQSAGLERWLPVGFTTTTGRMTVLPGDSLYPVTGSGTKDEYNFEESGKLKNRMGFTSPVHCRLSCNIEDSHGHVRPLNLIDIMNEHIEKEAQEIPSKL